MTQNNKNTVFSDVRSLQEMGEFGLIDRIQRLFNGNTDSQGIGIGDDCAVIPIDNDYSMLVTTDMLIEDRHFRRDWISAKDLGYKSLAVNLSDISAMGGKPEHAFLSIGLPDDISPGWLEDFFLQTHTACEQYGVRLSGGDTTKSPRPIVINYTVLGRICKKHIHLRSDAVPGDRIALLGNPGDSGAGFRLLKEQVPVNDNRHLRLIDAHNRPPLFVDEAQFLAQYSGVHALIDLSDGLRPDAGHIAERSNVIMRIELDTLPLSPEFTETCREFSWDMYNLALTAGEDYGLLFTLNPEQADGLARDFESRFGYRFSIIGDVQEGKADVVFKLDGRVKKIQTHGFDHFRSP